ncbi:50S ribosomal protein L18 [Candidatus Parcubacteria bacterium A4]|nr:MAG: 50S ribosomal protein L18 [Candidatus Parcubacteria bacterium A4]
MKKETKNEKRIKRHKRVRAKISGTTGVPRLCVFRSHKHIYAQLIDDENGKTILNSNDLNVELKKDKKAEGRKIKKAFDVGKGIAQEAAKKKIQKIVFDRGGYKYHGRVKSLAEGAREGGLQF